MKADSLLTLSVQSNFFSVQNQQVQLPAASCKKSPHPSKNDYDSGIEKMAPFVSLKSERDRSTLAHISERAEMPIHLLASPAELT